MSIKTCYIADLAHKQQEVEALLKKHNFELAKAEEAERAVRQSAKAKQAKPAR